MGMKLLSHLMKLLHLMTLPSQQFCLCGTLFNVDDTLMKHALRLALQYCSHKIKICGIDFGDHVMVYIEQSSP